jgi:HEAT repeat protein
VYAHRVTTASALVQRLRTVGSDLPSFLAAQIVALGREAAPLLLGLLDGRPVGAGNGAPAAPETCSDCGQQHDDLEWARSHAVDLLTELREPAAIETMLKVLEGTPCDEPIHDKIVERLPDFGSAALEPTLSALARTTKETETFESLCCILSVLGVRDERILQALLGLLTVHPRAAAMYLSDYGDPAACPAMLGVIAAFKADIEDSVERMELFDLLDAYASLGGELPASVKARIDAWLGS